MLSNLHFIMLMALLTLFLLQGRRQFDALMKHRHQNDHHLWEQDGRPLGFFWRPEGEKVPWLAGSRARSRCFRNWLWLTPESADAFVQRKLLWVRLSTAISYLGFFAAGSWLVFFAGAR